MFRLRRYLRPFRFVAVFGAFCKWLEAVFELIVPLVMAKIIDVGIANGDIPYIWKMGGVMVLLGVAGLGFSLVCQYLASRASQGVGTNLRRDLYAHINGLSHKELDALGTSSLITRMTNDINQLQVAVAMLIRLVVRAPFLAVGAMVMAMLIDLKLSVIFLITTPLVALVLYLIMSKSIPYFRVMQKKLDRVGQITQENLEGARVIRAFRSEKREQQRFDEASEDLARTAIRVGKLSALLNPLTFVLMNAAIAAIVWFGGQRVNMGTLEQGQIIAFVNYMTQVLLAVVVVANLVVIFTKASASATRVNEIFDTQSSIADGDKSAPEPKPGSPRVEFDDVSFSYMDDGKYALEHLTFSIGQGQHVGIIGGTGSGKTTLVNLIARFYDADSGEVRVDGRNVREYPLAQLRGKIGMVPQKAVLFTGTVADNLRWGKKDASREELERAMKAAQAWEFVQKLPEKENTRVSQGGKNLSGGQRQRLTIARALVGNPEILIFDDSSSALDFATDAALRKALREQAAEATVITVSQRASAIAHCSRILVLDDGRLCGMGTHEELLDSCETYREICRSQGMEAAQ